MGITKRFNGTQLEQELTKPCPLMPDGKWVHLQGKLTWNADTETYTTTNISNDDLIITNYRGSGDTTNPSIYLQTRSSNVHLLECRESVDMTSDVNLGVQIPLQASLAWFIQPSHLQGYQMFPPTDTTQLSGGIITVDIYAYYIIV